MLESSMNIANTDSYARLQDHQQMHMDQDVLDFDPKGYPVGYRTRRVSDVTERGSTAGSVEAASRTGHDLTSPSCRVSLC